MFFLLNDIVLDVDPARMAHPLEADRFSALGVDYITQLGREMFAEDAQTHRANPERARRLAFLIHLKMPRVNAAEFFVNGPSGRADVVEVNYKALNDIALMALFNEQKQGQLNPAKVDSAVWQRRAA